MKNTKIKFIAWDKKTNQMVGVDSIEFIDALEGRTGVNVFSFEEDVKKGMLHQHESRWLDEGKFELLQWTGLKDKNGKEIYHKHILTFDNGDMFVVEKEEWMEFFVQWIGEPECEDQVRDLYRIERATIVGNTFENPELLNK